jgi:sarcosine oxidase delta subunit
MIRSCAAFAAPNQEETMNKTEFRKFWHLNRDQRSLAAYKWTRLPDGREFLGVMRDLNWSHDRLDRRATMARVHGARAALLMTVRTATGEATSEAA